VLYLIIVVIINKKCGLECLDDKTNERVKRFSEQKVSLSLRPQLNGNILHCLHVLFDRKTCLIGFDVSFNCRKSEVCVKPIRPLKGIKIAITKLSYNWFDD